MVMIMVNIFEAKAKLSEYIEAAARGEQVVICKHNQPVAELRPVEQIHTGRRDLTPMYPGATFTTPAFFEPLPAEDLASWEGGDGEVARVAEQRAEYQARPTRRRKAKARR
jgi:prevent-host-death family protein